MLIIPIVDQEEVIVICWTDRHFLNVNPVELMIRNCFSEGLRNGASRGVNAIFAMRFFTPPVVLALV